MKVPKIGENGQLLCPHCVQPLTIVLSNEVEARVWWVKGFYWEPIKPEAGWSATDLVCDYCRRYLEAAEFVERALKERNEKEGTVP